MIERSVLLSDGEIFPTEWLQLREPTTEGDADEPTVEGNHIILPLDGSLSLEDMDRYIVSTALERAGHNMSAAARTLGTTRQTLRYRAQKYGLTDPKS